jgi:hypothetical protein
MWKMSREHADDDGRAFRPHLAGAELLRAQERFLAALLRCPSLWANASRSNIRCRHFPSSLRSIFDLATAPEKIRDAVTSGDNPTVVRLYHLPVHLNGGVVLSLGRQIVESIRRAEAERSTAEPANEVPVEVPLAVPTAPTRNAQALAPADQAPAPDASAPDTCKSGVDFTAMADDSTSLSDEHMDSRASDVQKSDPPAIATAGRALGSKDAVTAFLLAVLADGPLRAREIERMATVEGLLADGKAIGDAKPFRSARQALGIKPFQQSGRKGGGWIWVLPGQAPIHRKPEGG